MTQLALFHYDNSLNSTSGAAPCPASGVAYDNGKFGKRAYLQTGGGITYPCGPGIIESPLVPGPSKSQNISELSSAQCQFSPVRIPDYLDMQVSAYSAEPHPQSPNWEPPGHQETRLCSFSHPVRQWAWSARTNDQSISPSPAGLPVLRRHITHSDQNTSLSLSLSLRPLSLPGWNLHRLTHQSGSFRRFLFAGALLPLGAQLLNLLSEGSDQSFQMAHTALQAAEVRRRCRHSGERREPVF